MVSSADSTERFLTALHKAVYLVDRTAERLLKERVGGTFPQFLLLMSISKCPGNSQQKLAAFLDLTPAAVSRQIDALCDAKLVLRTTDPNSRRSHIVNLTPKGHAQLESMKELLLTSFASEMRLSSADTEAATDVLERVIAMLGHDDPHTT